MRLTLKVSGAELRMHDSRPKDASRRLPAASALTELIVGKTLSQALELRREDVIAAVGGLPQASTHAAQLALDALSAALSQIGN